MFHQYFLSIQISICCLLENEDTTLNRPDWSVLLYLQRPFAFAKPLADLTVVAFTVRTLETHSVFNSHFLCGNVAVSDLSSLALFSALYFHPPPPPLALLRCSLSASSRLCHLQLTTHCLVLQILHPPSHSVDRRKKKQKTKKTHTSCMYLRILSACSGFKRTSNGFPEALGSAESPITRRHSAETYADRRRR